MITERSIKKDFTVLDKHLLDLEKNSASLKDLSDMNGDEAIKKFVRSVRSLYIARQAMLRAAVKEEGKIKADNIRARPFDEKVLEILGRMREGQEFSPKVLEENLKKGLEDFLDIIYFATAYQHTPSPGFNLMLTRFGSRKRLLERMQWTFKQETAKGVLKDEMVEDLMHELDALIGTSYDELLTSLQTLNKLFGEYETGLHNLFVQTEKLNFIKGVEIKKAGFWNSLFGRTEMKNVGMLTEQDRRRVAILQGWTTRLHEVQVTLIRRRQADVMQKIHRLRAHELSLAVILAKTLGKKRKVRFAKVA